MAINQTYLLNKFPGKGGWTYAEIPEIAQNPDNPFGWVKVKGTIDRYPLNHYKLMPMGNGKLFLPVKKEIRKAIKKEAGDMVHVILEIDDSEIRLPFELKECFELEPNGPRLIELFESLKEGDRKLWIDAIDRCKTDTTKSRKIVELIEYLGSFGQ